MRERARERERESERDRVRAMERESERERERGRVIVLQPGGCGFNPQSSHLAARGVLGQDTELLNGPS